MSDEHILSNYENLNPIAVRQRLHVQHVINEARASINLDHPGLVGAAREILVEQILRPNVRPDVQFGTGKLTDRKGNLSGEIDVIL